MNIVILHLIVMFLMMKRMSLQFKNMFLQVNTSSLHLNIVFLLMKIIFLQVVSLKNDVFCCSGHKFLLFWVVESGINDGILSIRREKEGIVEKFK